jgi:hypothetical protein
VAAVAAAGDAPRHRNPGREGVLSDPNPARHRRRAVLPLTPPDQQWANYDRPDGAGSGRQNQGELTGRNPTDRGKAGTKYDLLVDANGLILHTLLEATSEPRPLKGQNLAGIAVKIGLSGRADSAMAVRSLAWLSALSLT